MKKKITTFIFFLLATVSYSQIKVKIENSKLILDHSSADKTVIQIINDKSADREKTRDIKITDYEPSDEQEISLGTIRYKKVAAKNKIIFWIDTQGESTAQPLYYCKDTQAFSKDETCKTDGKKTEEKAQEETQEETTLSDFPFDPYDSASRANKKIINNRVLIIDASSDKFMASDETGLYKFRLEEHSKSKKSDSAKATSDGKERAQGKESEVYVSLIKAEALPVNRFLSVMIENYNFYELEKFTITLNAESYKYDHDLRKVYDLVTREASPTGDGTKATADQGVGEKSEKQNEIKAYLTNALEILKGYPYLNINDLYKLQEYKIALNKYAAKHKEEFNAENNAIKSKIISWFPKFVSLTPISIKIPDNDEVSLSYSLKAQGVDVDTKSLGNYKTFGGVSVDYGAAFYLTDLRNNNVYTKTTGTVADNNQNTRAHLASSNEDSIGFGLNIDVSYRTGVHFRPTFNFGFFVPLEEEITPFIATGPGVGFYSKNYKLNFSWGLALGKINSIKEEYKDTNLSGLTLTNEDLTEKVLKTGHYYSLSISFNVFD